MLNTGAAQNVIKANPLNANVLAFGNVIVGQITLTRVRDKNPLQIKRLAKAQDVFKLVKLIDVDRQGSVVFEKLDCAERCHLTD